MAPAALLILLAADDGGYDILTRQRLGLVIWWGLALAVAFAVVPRAVPPRGWKLAAAGLAGLAAVQVLSFAWGPSTERAVAEAVRSISYLGVLALAWCGLGPRTWRDAATGIFVAAAGISLYALAGRLWPSIVDLSELELSLGSDRLFAPLGYWNGLGAWTAMAMAMALAWSADGKRTDMRALSAALIPALGVVVYLTYSRGAVLGAALGVVLVIALTRNRPRAAIHAFGGAATTAIAIFAVRAEPAIADGSGGEGAAGVVLVLAMAMSAMFVLARWTRVMGAGRSAGELPHRAHRLATGAVALLAVGLLALALVAGRDGFGRGGDAAALDSVDPSARLTTAAGNRSAYWSESLDAFVHNPLGGEGAGSFSYRWASSGSDTELVSDAHSIVFETAAELGVLGLACLALFVGGLVAAAMRGLAAAGRSAPATGLVAAFGVYLFAASIDWMWELTVVTYLGLGCAGTVAMAGSERLRRSRLRPRWRWGLVVGGIAAGALAVPALVSTELIRDAQEQQRLGAPATAINFANEALDAAPWSATAYATRAEAELQAGLVDEAEGDIVEAIEREPLEPNHLIVLAAIAVERGDTEAARAILDAAVGLSPHNPRLGSQEVADLGAEIERIEGLD